MYNVYPCSQDSIFSSSTVCVRADLVTELVEGHIFEVWSN